MIGYAVWDIPNGANSKSNTASFPKELVEIPLRATCPYNGVVMDIFAGSGTVGNIAEEMGIHSISIELREEFINK